MQDPGRGGCRTRGGEDAGPREGRRGPRRGRGDPGRGGGERGMQIPDRGKTSQPPAPRGLPKRARGWYTVRSSLGEMERVPGHSGLALP